MEPTPISPSYEPPCIEVREPIDLPLIGAPAGSVVLQSAAFRTESLGAYVPPRIEARQPVSLPLIGAVAVSVTFDSAAFRSEPAAGYEPPRIAVREPIDLPLIGVPAGSGPIGISAEFRSELAEGYAAPCIEAREPIDLPLIGAPVGSVVFSAAFRSEPAEEYEAPRVEAREPIDLPLIGGPAAVSGPPPTASAAFRTETAEAYEAPRGRGTRADRPAADRRRGPVGHPALFRRVSDRAGQDDLRATPHHRAETVDLPLILVAASAGVDNSAVFRTAVIEAPYEAPRVEAREDLDLPLTVAASFVPCARFRSTTIKS